jgi:hypothetical protein
MVLGLTALAYCTCYHNLYCIIVGLPHFATMQAYEGPNFFYTSIDSQNRTYKLETGIGVPTLT